jgi:imidazolonepropionase-like amidohydrolase
MPDKPALPSGEGMTAIVDVTVVPMDGERTLPGHTVLVRGDRILELGPVDKLPTPSGAKVIDGKGKFLIPGLVDMHVHLPRQADLSLYVARGVTTVRNMWGAPIHLEWRDRITKGEIVGPSIFTTGPILDGEDPVHDGSFVIRTPEDADRAIALTKQSGYDFLKVLTKIPQAPYDHLLARAKTAGLEVIGHIPRAVTFEHAIDSGQIGVEHLNTFYGALQADDSPVKGKTDPASRERWIDHIDEKKIPGLVRHIKQRGVWICPTRVVMNQLEPVAEQRRRLELPETLKYIPPATRIVWQPWREPSPEEAVRNQRELAVQDAIVRGLHQGGARVIAGTDVGNPLIIPGFTLHEELARYVAIGLSAHDALLTATVRAAEFLGTKDVGTIAPGKRADLVLLEGNPLTDIRQTERIVGVMLRGRWLDEAERKRLLDEAEAATQGKVDPFLGLAELGTGGEKRHASRFQISWKDVPFDTERVLVEMAGEQRVIHGQSYDPHQGQWSTMTLWTGASGKGERLVLASEGANGRGRVEVTRKGKVARVEGTLVSGDRVSTEVPLDENAWLVPDRFLASKFLVAAEIEKLKPKDHFKPSMRIVSLGSNAEVKSEVWDIQRLDPKAKRFEIELEKGKPQTLTLDAEGWPSELESASHGAKLHFLRLPSK